MKKKIVIIGAGSSVFGPATFSDLYLSKILDGSTIVLCDIDEVKLEMIYQLLQYENEKAGNKYILEQTTDRKEALQNADFIISSVEQNRYQLRGQDRNIPLRYGATSRQGENGGPGGFFHSARVIKLVLGIAEDVMNICPNAYFFNFSNPMSRVCLAIHRKFPELKVVGFCHQIEILQHYIPDMLNRPLNELEFTVAGLNHFGFLLGLKDTNSNEDLMPLFTNKNAKYFEDKADRFYLSDLTFEVYKRFGYFPHPGDNHLCEYLQFAHEYVSLKDTDDWFERGKNKGIKTTQKLENLYNQLISGEELSESLLSPESSGERVIPIIEAISTNKRTREDSVNIPNNGIIENLPQDLIIEGPAWVDGNGVEGIKMGSLPKNIAALLRIEASIQDVCVEAILTESKDLAIACLAMDTKVGSFKMAENIYRDLYKLQKDYLPNFQ